MNNALGNIPIDLGLEFPQDTDNTEHLREREAKLVRMIEALVALSGSNEWSTLKDELFEGAQETIEQRIRSEAGKAEVNISELYRLQGEQKWAKRYGDPMTLVGSWRNELANIRKQLNPPGPAGI